jgi:hypothetical protein
VVEKVVSTITGGSTKGGGVWGGVKGKFYTDPDYVGGNAGSMQMPSPAELEAQFYRLKQPVNPNGGPMSDPVDTSSPPPQKNGLDPTVIHVDPDVASSGGGTGGINKLDIAPIDHVPNWQPEPGKTPSPGDAGAGGDPIGVHMP